MTAVLAIAWSSVLELRRQRLLIVPIIGFVLSLLGLGGALLLAEGSLELKKQDAEIAALGTGIGAAFGGTLYAAIVGAGLIAREISAGTMLMLAARPIGRWQIIAGRALGAGAFLVAMLLMVCVAYAIVAAITSGSLAPIDEPFVALAYGVPAMLLGLAFGTACSIQSKATAATGSAIGIMIFAWVVGIYADSWREERHIRSHLAADVQERLEANDELIGPASITLTRALPFWVFTQAATDAIEERDRDRYPAHVIEDHDDGRIDTTEPAGYVMGYATPAPAPIDAATGDPGDPVAAVPAEPRIDLPDDPDDRAFDCARYNGARCFIGYRDAWKVKSFAEVSPIGSGWGLLWAWLAIPAWLGIAMLRLHRRRDLT